MEKLKDPSRRQVADCHGDWPETHLYDVFGSNSPPAGQALHRIVPDAHFFVGDHSYLHPIRRGLYPRDRNTRSRGVRGAGLHLLEPFVLEIPSTVGHSHSSPESHSSPSASFKARITFESRTLRSSKTLSHSQSRSGNNASFRFGRTGAHDRRPVHDIQNDIMECRHGENPAGATKHLRMGGLIPFDPDLPEGFTRQGNCFLRFSRNLVQAVLFPERFTA